MKETTWVKMFIRVTFLEIYDWIQSIYFLLNSENQGVRIDGNEIKEVAFKEPSEKYLRFENKTDLYHEKEVYEAIGDHGKQIRIL